MMTLLVVLISALIGSIIGTAWLRRRALACGLLDIPNARSSHQVSTPRGGGAAIVVLVCGAVVVLWQTGHLLPAAGWSFLGGGVAVGMVGYLDDRRHVPAMYRLLVHFLAAIWMVGWMVLPPGSSMAFEMHWFAGILAILALAWMINLYNFMDGIDGLAGSEAVAVGGGAAALLWMSGAPGLAMVAAVSAAASLGFLAWNWPPAKIFMGDVGSGFLGFIFGALALISIVQGAMTPWVWPILLGIFIVDATLTLIRRFLRGERVHEAHRSHAYQLAAHRFGSHRPVTLIVAAVNLLWLLPLAALATRFPEWGMALLAVAWLPLGATWWRVCRRQDPVHPA